MSLFVYLIKFPKWNNEFSCFKWFNIIVSILWSSSTFIHGLVSDSCTNKLLIELILLKSVSISANDYTVNSIIHMLIC